MTASAIDAAAGFLSVYSLDPDARILVVTSNWPHTDEPRHDDAERHGIFVARQVQALRDLDHGYRFDVAFLRGFAGKQAYALAARFLTRRRTHRRYQLIHAHGGEAGLLCALCWRGPLLISYCGDDLLGTPDARGIVPWQGRLRRMLIRQSARLADRTITKSPEMERHLPARLRARNSVIPNGVDASVFAPVDRTAARERLGWQEGERVVLFAADPRVPRKRYELAKAACDSALAHIPSLRLQMAHGTDPDLMPSVMNASDCLLMTSSVEGSPNVVKEALMCNLPVVATPVGDVRELLRHVHPSEVADAQPNELGKALVECLEPLTRSNGRAVSHDLRGDVIAHRVSRIYEDLLA